MASPSTTADDDRSPVIGPVTYGVGLAMISYAATQLLHQPQYLPYGLAASVLVAVLGSLGAVSSARRMRPIRDLHTALAPTLGASFTRDQIRGSKREHGRPTKIVIRYPATFDERDPKNREEVRDIIGKRLGGRVVATWDPTRRRVVAIIEPTPDATQIVDSDTPVTAAGADDTPERARLRSRATDVVTSIMGATAKVVDVAFDGDMPSMIEVKYATTSRDLSLNFRQRVIMQLDSKLPGEWRDLWDLENDCVRFELRPPFPSNVRYPLMEKPKKFELPYSVTENNQIESWKLGSKDPHCLAIGPTGSGKTVFLRNLVVGARLLGIPVVLCDPKMTEYLDFIGVPGVRVITDVKEIASAITRTNGEMMRRYAGIKDRTVKKGEYGKILFILDEFFIFKEMIKEIWQEMRAADKDLKGREHPCLSHWSRLVALARTAEIHLCVGIQRPDAEFLTGLARDSLRKRISLDRTTREAAAMLWGDSRIGRDLPSVQGRATATTNSGPGQVQVLRLLTPGDDDYDDYDADVWEQLVHRMTVAAEQYALTHIGDPLDYLGYLGEREQTATGQATALALAPAAIETQADIEVEHDQADDAHGTDAGGEMEPVGVYELEVGDRIELDDGDIAEILDLHFDETDDGEEVVEVTLVTESGTETRELGVEDTVQRRTEG